MTTIKTMQNGAAVPVGPENPMPVQGTPPADLSAAGSIAALNGVLSLTVAGRGGFGLVVGGTFVGTLAVQGSIDGVRWDTIGVAPLSGGARVSTITAAGAWEGISAGLVAIRVVATAWTSGTATVALLATDDQRIIRVWCTDPANFLAMVYGAAGVALSQGAGAVDGGTLRTIEASDSLLVSTLVSILARLPALGSAAPASSQPVVIANDSPIGAAASVAAVNVDLLTGTGSGWYDAASFQSASIQIIGSAGISAGAITFEQTNDTTAAASGNLWAVEEMTTLNPTPNVAAITIAASTTRLFGGPVLCRYIRVRVSTGFVGGTVQAVAMLSQLPYSRQVQTVHQATGGNLNTVAVLGAGASTIGTLAAGSSAIGDVGVQYRANATGAAGGAHVVSAAGTNGTSGKASAGRLLGWQLANTTASWKFLKLHNTAGIPTAGAGVVRTIGIPPNGISTWKLEGGIAFSTGIGYTITGAYADNDTTGVAAGDVVGDLFFA